MLQGDFFTISNIEITGFDIKATLIINATHKIFNGHFPGQPVVPGVCMLQMVKEIMEQVIEKKTDLIKSSEIKFLAVIDFEVKHGRMVDYRYHLLPVFSELLPADPAMQATIDRVRAPFQTQLQEPIAESHELLFRRGNFNGSWDQLIVEALMQVKDAEITFSPGFRWGTTLLPGTTITRENLMEQTAITYPHTSVAQMTGAEIKQHLEKQLDILKLEHHGTPMEHQKSN